MLSIRIHLINQDIISPLWTEYMSKRGEMTRNAELNTMHQFIIFKAAWMSDLLRGTWYTCEINEGPANFGDAP